MYLCYYTAFTPTIYPQYIVTCRYRPNDILTTIHIGRYRACKYKSVF